MPNIESIPWLQYIAISIFGPYLINSDLYWLLYLAEGSSNWSEEEAGRKTLILSIPLFFYKLYKISQILPLPPCANVIYESCYIIKRRLIILGFISRGEWVEWVRIG